MKRSKDRDSDSDHRTVPSEWHAALQLIAPLLALVAVILFVVFVAL